MAQVIGSNRIRWREHELILVTIACLSGIAGFCWMIFSTSQEWIENEYARPFLDNHLSFSFYANVLLPGSGLFLLIYLCYLRMSLYILPRLLQIKALEKGSFHLHFSLSGRIAMEGDAGAALKRSLWALLYAFLLILLLGAGWGIAIYYQNPEYCLLPDCRTLILGEGLRRSFNLIAAYSIYVAVREAAIRWMESTTPRNSYRITLTNQVSAFFLIYFAFGIIIFNFHVVLGPDHPFYIWYFIAIPPSVFVCLTNLYWLFPMKGQKSLFHKPILWRWIKSTALWTMPFTLFLHINPPGMVVGLFFAIWSTQLMIVTPLSWLIYQQRKDKILQLRGLEAELGQSKADLEFLRSQINPHFLFNVLNTLYGSALQENAGSTAAGIQQLGDMMRFMLHENNLDQIPMEKEIGYLRNYIALQQLRSQSSPTIRIQSQIDEAFCDHRIAPMLLIPFVENAFKHGISLREESWIRIKLHCTPKSIHFEVRNSVHSRQGEDPEKDRSGIGMKNVLHRLNLLYAGRHEFFVHQDEREFFIQLSIQP